jgi:hypothetical protein
MPLMCIRKRSTDGRRYEGIWACACGRSKDRLRIPRIESDHTFLATVLPIENLPLARVLIRVRNRPLQERHRTGRSREQMSLWLAGYPKTPGFDVRFGSLAAAARSKWDVRFTPESCRGCRRPARPLWAKTGLMHRSK